MINIIRNIKIIILPFYLDIKFFRQVIEKNFDYQLFFLHFCKLQVGFIKMIRVRIFNYLRRIVKFFYII